MKLGKPCSGRSCLRSIAIWAQWVGRTKENVLGRLYRRFVISSLLLGRVQYIVNTHSNISIKNLSLNIFSCSVPSPMCFEMPV
jgi:hypothetical protein